jgi:hypothetical protein
MKRIKKLSVVLTSLFGAGAVIVTALNVFAIAPQPVLTIAPLGSNQFSISITNGVSTNYTLFWTPVLADENYPWQFLGVFDIGQSNLTVNAGDWPSGFFRALVGIDSDSDGIPDWMDAAPLDPNVGILSLTINSPTNGATLN